MEDQSKPTKGTHDLDRTLPSPHFDDEATLLSARPVVPFHELSARNSRRRLSFGAGLVIALLIGLLSGIFYARMEDAPQLRSETPPATTAAKEELVSTTEAQEELDSTTDAPAESLKETPVSVESTPLTVEKSVRKIASPRRNPITVAEKPVSLPTRRLRREPVRHPQTSDDLFRIQEIFEGSSRP